MNEYGGDGDLLPCISVCMFLSGRFKGKLVSVWFWMWTCSVICRKWLNFNNIILNYFNVVVAFHHDYTIYDTQWTSVSVSATRPPDPTIDGTISSLPARPLCILRWCLCIHLSIPKCGIEQQRLRYHHDINISEYGKNFYYISCNHINIHFVIPSMPFSLLFLPFHQM